MKKILMTDLEGVLIASDIGFLNHKSIPKYNGYNGLRNYAKYFMNECRKLFDDIYVSTCCSEENAKKVFEEGLNFPEIKYYNWRKLGDEKASRYDLFKDDLLIHLEDSIETPPYTGPVSGDVVKHGQIFIPVKGFYPHHAWSPKEADWRKNDRELLIVLDKIKRVLSSK